jgi:hypothetical protein
VQLYAIEAKPRSSTRVLLIPELVNLVLEKVDFNTLTSICRTAKFLQMPASALIWARLDQSTVNNLFKLVLDCDGQVPYMRM